MNILFFRLIYSEKTKVFFQLLGERGFNHILVETSDNTEILHFQDNKLHAFLENASRWMKTRHKYGRMKAHGMRPAFYAATSARNKLVFALPLNHKLSMP